MPTTGTRSPYCWWNFSRAGISSRQGSQRACHRLISIGPRSEESATSGPPPRQGRVMSGSPPSTGSPVPGVQSSMPMRALALRSAGVSTSTSGGRTAMGPPSLIDDQAKAPRGDAHDERQRQQELPHAGPCVVTSFSASIGSVGPAPNDGHSRATGQAPQAGFLAWQRRRPCQMRWWRQHRPVALGEEGADGVLDLDRVGLLGPAEAPDEPAEVGVDGDAGHVEGVAEHDVGGLAARRRAGSPGRRGGGGTSPSKLLDERLAELEQRVGLRPEEAERAEELLEVLARRRRPSPRASGRPRTARGWRR